MYICSISHGFASLMIAVNSDAVLACSPFSLCSHYVCPMKKASRAGSHFKFHPVADSSDEDAPPVPVVPVDTSLRHIHFNNTSRHGPSNSRNTYVAGGASPNKIPDTQPLSSRPDDWNFEAAPPEINETNYPWLDPAYQHQMDLESHSHQVPPKARTRTAAVSYLHHTHTRNLTDY